MIHDHCVACGQSGNLNQHHLVPRSIGGSDDDSNLITLCGSCHTKAHQVKADWRHSELTKKALSAKKARGERMGKLSYGFKLSDDGVHVVPCELEQSILRKVCEVKNDGYSLQRIANTLNDQSMFNRQGNPWNPALLHTICKDLDQRIVPDFAMFLEGRRTKARETTP